MLEPTYGVITYQEQVMRIANVLAGFSLAEADVLRKAVGKKDAELIKKELGKFVERAVALGHPKKLADELAAQIETFGRYGFNKSHSVAYSVLSYQTAWLKTHYPAEFMAALLSSEIGNTDKVVQYINEARELGLRGPAARRERVGLQVHGGGRHADPLRPGRGAERRPGRHRVDHRGPRGGPVRDAGRPGGPHRPPALQQAGGRVPHRRRRLRFAGRTSQAAARGAGAALQRSPAQAAGSRGGPGIALRRDARPSRAPARPTLPDVPHGPKPNGSPGRRKCIGFFISGHPLERFRDGGGALRRPHHRDAARMERAPGDTSRPWSPAVKRQISKKTGKEYARMVLEDFHGTAEAIVFPERWARLNQRSCPTRRCS